MKFHADHEKGDTRVWFHAHHFNKVIIYRPDTDTFLIGLPLISCYGLSAIVWAKDRLIVDVDKLLDSIKRDPDLATIPEEDSASAITATYVASGCDYTSFFAGVGKRTFFKSLFRHGGFIYGTGASLHEQSASSFRHCPARLLQPTTGTPTTCPCEICLLPSVTVGQCNHSTYLW